LEAYKASDKLRSDRTVVQAPYPLIRASMPTSKG
jgi:hypothetical protein